MNTLLKTGTIGLAGMVTAGLVAWPAMTANASEDRAAAKRDDDTQVVVTTVDDEDDDDTGLRGTNTRTRGGGDTNTRSRDNSRTGTNSGHDNSRDRSVRDLTNDGPGKGNVDRSRNHTNDRSRHNTRG